MIREIGNQIWWLDFREYVGVFQHPRAVEAPADDDGRKLRVPTLVFDGARYRAELHRAQVAHTP